ncbi:MAG TPA: hypothetical protein VIN40_07810 [Candidatus Tyrphobacter sp.]
MISIDMREAVLGVIGPKERWILAAPLNGGGSGGAFEIAIFSIKHHAINLVQEIPLGAGIRNLAIRNHVLIAHYAHFLPGDAHCCPKGESTIILADPHGYVESVERWWSRIDHAS